MAMKSSSETSSSSFSWIRGVNIAGWLVAELFVTPYLFALNSCQLQGDWCFYPNQLGALPTTSRQHKYCDMYFCKPHLVDMEMGDDTMKEYPVDEKSLLASFSNKALAKQYMTFHWENFITREDIRFMAEEGGVEYVKVPIPHYAMNDILDDEPWVDGQWMYFVRFVGWAREYNIQVWIDFHTTFGTQIGFDETGFETSPEDSGCDHWLGSSVNVERSLNAVKNMAQAVMDDNLRDVVTGFGIMNEPSSENCPVELTKRYSDKALRAVREIMGDDTAVYIADSLNAATWNDGWWTDATGHKNTYIDSHYFHTFSDSERALSPKQHIAHTCKKFARETASCCYKDHPKNKKVSDGVSRIVGEWSAGFDICPSDMVHKSMDAIRDPKIAKPLLMDRTLSEERMSFLKNHVESQMVTYESSTTGVSSGWFFWTLKMEGGAFAEWDFTRGIKEGWIPKIPDKKTSSLSIFGSCESIMKKTIDDMSILQQFPNSDDRKRGSDLSVDDDFVLSFGKGKTKTSSISSLASETENPYTREKLTSPSSIQADEESEFFKNFREQDSTTEKSRKHHWFRFFALCFLCYGVWTVFLKNEYGFGRRRGDYDALHRTELYL